MTGRRREAGAGHRSGSRSTSSSTTSTRAPLVLPGNGDAAAVRLRPVTGSEAGTEGEEPDPRWSLANERTLLAYNRTALSLVVAGLAVIGSRAIAGTPAELAVIGLPLIALGAGVAFASRRRFSVVQQAMRTGQALPEPLAATLLPLALAVLGALSFVLAAVALVRLG